MKNAILNMKLMLMVLSTVLLFSCSGDDGEDGAIGPQGISGVDGTNGADGVDGTNGQDGNANVTTYVFDLSSESGALISSDIPDMTQDVVENDLILGYLRNSQSDTYYAIPTSVWPNGTGGFYDVTADITVGSYTTAFYEVGTQNLSSITSAELGELKVVIATSNNTITGKSGKNSLLADMKNFHVDINNYHEVMDYFGLDN